MFDTKFRILVPLACLVTTVLAQDRNVTVVDTDPSIVYSGQGTGDAPICQVDANGNVQGGQAGCYFFPTKCTSSVAMSQNSDGKAGAAFKFTGSAIYVNSGLDEISPIFTVTLDGQSTDVDGVRPSPGFTCAPLFSKTDLDPTVEHTITLSVKGPSPNRNMTVDPNGTALVFSLIDFIYTVSNSSSNSTDSSSSNSSTSAGASLSTPPASTSTSSSASATNSAASNSSAGTDPSKSNSAASIDTASVLRSGMLVLGVWRILGAAGFSI